MQDLTRFLDKLLSHGGQVNTRLASFKQGNTELIFQSLHTNRQCRLTHEAFGGCTAKMLLVGDGDNVSELCEGHCCV